MEKEMIMNKVDHTLLKQTATWEEIKQIIDDGIKFNTASVCIPPCYVEQAKNYANNKIKICTVIGFPNGNNTTQTKVYETRDAIANGAEEIDMVINIGMLKAKNYDYVKSEIQEIANTCHRTPTQNGNMAILKVIIETCLLTEEEIRKMCEIVKNTNAEFIKTSTGFSTEGATKEVVEIMKNEIDKNGGGLLIKAAGGIKNFDDAEMFINIGADRLGTSRLVNLLKV